MNENKDVVGEYFIIFLRVLITVGLAVAIMSVVYLVAQGVPIIEFFAGANIMLVLSSFFLMFLMYSSFKLLRHKERKKQNAAMQEGHADGSNAVNQQQSMTKLDSSKRFRFWLGICCGIVTASVLFWLLFDRVLFSVIFS